jgi:hypothetical protein
MNADRFLDAIVEVEELLRQSEAANVGSQYDLESMITRSTFLTSEHKRKLHSWRKLRNVIVHSSRVNSKPIADPRDTELVELEKLVSILRNPPRVSSVLDFVTPVVLRWDSEVSDFFSELMPPKEFSQAPFTDQDGTYKLITSNAVARWAASSYEVNSGVIIEKTLIAEVANYSEEGDKLVSRRHDLTCQEAIDILTNPNGIPPAAILLTDTGHEGGRAMGLAVKADLPALYKSLQL